MANSGPRFVRDTSDWLLEYVCRPETGTRHAILIDPADQTPEVAAKRCVAAVSAGSQMILVGGSTDTDMANVHDTIVAIRELWNWSPGPPARTLGPKRAIGPFP